MWFPNYNWYYSAAIPKKTCENIIKYGKSLHLNKALTGGITNPKKIKPKELKNMKRKRNSSVAWLDDQWLYELITPYLKNANQSAGWNFQWDWMESCQFTKYKPKQYYGWHKDSWEKPYGLDANKNWQGKMRKLSVIVNLTDPKEYTGGELEFDFRNGTELNKKTTKICKEIKPQGSVIVFPSFLWHRVKPVKTGTRYSIVVWSLGWPFS